MADADTQSSTQIPLPEELDFDLEALRRKYAAERARRLRPDANDQYRMIAGDFDHYNVDPYVEPGFTRPPLIEDIDVLVVGGGFGGQLAAVRLQEAGVTDFRIVEKAGDFGGTWYWNRYPGAQCDIEGYLYLPLLEETGYIPKERYSFQPEIFAHAQRIGRQYNLYERACFQTRIGEARWDDDRRRWTVTTDRDDVFNARFVIMSSGPLNKPKLPGVPGIEGFKGHTFHTSRWDYDYTGGDTTGDLHQLHDKRVGIIGTGATAIQSIPHLGEHAQHLYVFQRTPVVRRRAQQHAHQPEMGGEAEAGLAGPTQPQLHRPARRHPAGGRSGPGQMDQPPQEAGRPARHPGFHHVGRGAGAAGRDRRLPEDERDPRAGRPHRDRPGDGRGAQAVVRPVVQAAHLQRRLPARRSTGPT